MDECELCLGVGLDCNFCFGTGKSTKISRSFYSNHKCHCATGDRLNCPICKKKCHHDTSLSPRVMTVPM